MTVVTFANATALTRGIPWSPPAAPRKGETKEERGNDTGRVPCSRRTAPATRGMLCLPPARTVDAPSLSALRAERRELKPSSFRNILPSSWCPGTSIPNLFDPLPLSLLPPPHFTCTTFYCVSLSFPLFSQVLSHGCGGDIGGNDVDPAPISGLLFCPSYSLSFSLSHSAIIFNLSLRLFFGLMKGEPPRGLLHKGVVVASYKVVHVCVYRMISTVVLGLFFQNDASETTSYMTPPCSETFSYGLGQASPVRR